MKKKKMKRIKLLVIAAALLLVGGIGFLPGMTEGTYAEQTVQEDSVVLSNDEGQQLQVNVEEDLSAEDVERQAGSGQLGAVDLEDSSIPLAGFDPAVVNGDEDGDIHLGWMIALLLVAIAYAAYFSRYQSRLLNLRRKIAAAEFERRKEGRR